jgi:hypothetical protein
MDWVARCVGEQAAAFAFAAVLQKIDDRILVADRGVDSLFG